MGGGYSKKDHKRDTHTRGTPFSLLASVKFIVPSPQANGPTLYKPLYKLPYGYVCVVEPDESVRQLKPTIGAPDAHVTPS